MNTDIIKFFTLSRQIFGICPRSGKFCRLSDCKIFLKRKPLPDWMDNIDSKEERLDVTKLKLQEQEDELRDKAQIKGRRLAKLAVKKIDPVFTPLKLNPSDAKVIFHPIDYVVFNGMSNDGRPIKNIVVLDRQAMEREHRTLQKSIERVIERENYEWVTIRVLEDGRIKLS